MNVIQLGAIKQPFDIRDYKIVCSTSDFPKEYSLTHQEVKNQGSVCSCVAHAIQSLMESRFILDKNKRIKLSTDFIYGNRTGSFCKKGMCTRQALKNTVKYGDIEYRYCNTNTEMPEVENKFKKANENVIKNNINRNNITTYYRCGRESEIKESLMKDGPVLMVFKWPKCKVKNGIVEFEKEVMAKKHCVMCYGWDENGWKIQNSWGKNWGVSGCATIRYEYGFKECWGVQVDYQKVNITHSNIPDKIASLLNQVVRIFGFKGV